MKQVASSLKIELANYQELQAFSQFGSDLDQETKNVLNHGEKLMEVLKQAQYQPMDVIDQIIELFTAKYRYLDGLDNSQIRPFLDFLKENLHASYQDVLDDILDKKKIEEVTEKKLKEAISKYLNLFTNR
jgi:F-type H+-transporting ATPase subunit alpha